MSAYRFKLALVREPAPEPYGTQVTNPAGAAVLAARLLGDEFQEVALAMFFNARHELIGYAELGRGTINRCPMQPRELLVAALQINAAAVIVAHNHPSGSLEPSFQDDTMTKRLRDACEIVGLSLLDHLLVAAGGEFVSLLPRSAPELPFRVGD